MPMIDIRPQPGPQEQFLRSAADITFFGGAAYGGKTFALLLRHLRHINDPQFGAVIFRRTMKQVTSEGGLWDTAAELYAGMGAASRQSPQMQWQFSSGARISFNHLEHEKNKLDWQGSQIAGLGFDEVTHFTSGKFWYLQSRSRSVCSVRPYTVATCNPDPDSFVAPLISWWIDPDSGYAIPERSGKIRWFIRHGDEIEWGKRSELLDRRPGLIPRSLTFIPSKITDNAIGLEVNPDYIGTLQSLHHVDRERLLNGNWKIRAIAGDYFKRGYFAILERPPAGTAFRVRYWDRAATRPSSENPDPDWTVGLRLAYYPDTGQYVIEHVERFRENPGGVQSAIQRIAQQDGREVPVGLEQDPGQAGVVEIAGYVRALAGFVVLARSPIGSKTTRAWAASTQAEHGNMALMRGAWNDAFFAEAEGFPTGAHDDQVDALSGAFNMLSRYAEGPVYRSTQSRILY